MTPTAAKPQDRPAMDRSNPFWRSVGDEWPGRLVALIVGICLGLVVLNYYYQKRIVPEDLALGTDATSVEADWNGARVNAWRLQDYESVYPAAAAGAAPHREVVWLGNSQVHAVNQYKKGQTTGPAFASAALGRPVYGLTLPNANLQEHLVVAEWVLRRRVPEWMLVPVVFDDTREDGLRPDFKPFDTPELRADLGRSAIGADVVRELEKLSAAEKESQGTTHASKSLQVITEDALEGWADAHWDVWAKRGDILSTFFATDVYRLRNKIFGITSKSKRPMIPLRYEKNMAAFRAILRAATDAHVKVIVYVPPLRWDVEPPYYLDQYEACKAETKAAAREAGVYFLDLDRAVPSELWGERGQEIDFMHFQEGGHRLMGERLADAVRRAESGEWKPAGAE